MLYMLHMLYIFASLKVDDEKRKEKIEEYFIDVYMNIKILIWFGLVCFFKKGVRVGKIVKGVILLGQGSGSRIVTLD